jgi:hypothetical protein
MGSRSTLLCDVALCGFGEAGVGNFAIHANTFARSAGDYSIPGGKQANTGLDSIVVSRRVVARGDSLAGSASRWVLIWRVWERARLCHDVVEDLPQLLSELVA